MTTSALINPTPTPAWANSAAAVNYRPGKWEQRAWMVCFWATLIVALIQSLFTALGIWGMFTARSNSTFVGWLNWWEFLNTWGFLIDCVIGVIFTPLALYAFGKARNQGLRWSMPLYLWLGSRLIVALLLIACAGIMLVEYGNYPLLLLSNVVTRLLFFNLPIWLLMTSVGIAGWERRRIMNRPTETAPAPETPIDPLA